MPTVGVREFREDLSTYLDSPEPVYITRHGRSVGVFIPEEPRRPFNPEALLAAGAQLDADLAQRGIDPEDLVREFDQLRKAEHAQSSAHS